MPTKFQQETLKSRFAQAKVLVVGDVMLDRGWSGKRCTQYRLIGRQSRAVVRNRR